MLPSDRHVHSEWSWDALRGDMEATCGRAVGLGLTSIAFTDHADFTPWRIVGEIASAPGTVRPYIGSDGRFDPPELDLDGYRECVERCRDRFPELQILLGVELAEPHWHPEQAASLLRRGEFDLVISGLHSRRVDGGEVIMVGDGYDDTPATEVFRDYLAEITRMIETSDAFSVLAHIDYPIRHWPAGAGPYEPKMFEEEHRAALRALAATGRALEVNTRVPLHPQIVEWWRDVNGGAVTFASDAHNPLSLAFGFADAAAMVESYGFRPGRHPYDFWVRS
jgi:histidinol-phosphatase (PHP family)